VVSSYDDVGVSAPTHTTRKWPCALQKSGEQRDSQRESSDPEHRRPLPPGYLVQQEAAALSPERSAWIGGQGTEPYEQNTQQSPRFGRSRTPQPVHS
jgi:hypothetical protein